MKDVILRCKDCGERFVFTAKNQAYYAKRGWGPPLRCKECRKEAELKRLLYSIWRACGGNGANPVALAKASVRGYYPKRNLQKNH